MLEEQCNDMNADCIHNHFGEGVDSSVMTINLWTLLIEPSEPFLKRVVESRKLILGLIASGKAMFVLNFLRILERFTCIHSRRTV